MTTASVPSTLVKCLYLFFDLPEMIDDEADITDTNSEFTPKQRRILLQKIFVQVKIFHIFYYLEEIFISISNLILIYSYW